MSKSICKRKIKWTVADFIKFTGKQPEKDDLDRANCPKHGKSGHSACGVCHQHNLPVFMCHSCFINS